MIDIEKFRLKHIIYPIIQMCGFRKSTDHINEIYSHYIVLIDMAERVKF